MNNLSRHIEYLLLTHNCVVVPQFGAFVTRMNEASRTETENLFFPPKRVVRFNPDVLEDDGLLVGVLSALHQCPIGEAKRMAQAMVLDLRQQLLADGQVDFGSIGVFTQDEDGHVTFEPCEAGTVTPSLYGLDPFMMAKITTVQRQSSNKGKRHRSLEQRAADQESHITIRISRRSLRYAMLSAAAIVVCVLFAIPLDFMKTGNAEQASIVPTNVVEQATKAPAQKTVKEKSVAVTAQPAQPILAEPKAAETVVAEPKAAEPKVAESKAVETKAVEPKVVEPKAEAAQGYCIVLASNVSKKNADRYLSDLQARGYDKAAIHDNGKMLRVVITGFTNETDANNYNSELHHKSREFASTWVMKL